MTVEENKEFESLLMELTEGALLPEQKERLMELARQYPEAKEKYLEYCQVHTMLAWEHGVMGDLQMPEPSITPVPRAGSFSAWKPLAIAAAVALSAVVLWSPWGEDSKMKPGETVASLTRSVAATLELSGVPTEFDTGSAVRTGSYQLEEGLVQITFDSGVEVVIEAPASFEIHSPELMAIHEGRLTANVTPEGVGFTVETPDAEVVDFGTEFAIEVVREGSSEVHVFEGEVGVRPRQDGTSMDPVRLITNQATRIEHATLIPLGISVDQQRFFRSLDEPEPTFSESVRELLPLAYYRMGASNDGITLKDSARGHDLQATVTKGGRTRQSFAPGRIGSSLRLGGPKMGRYARIPGGLELPTAEFTIMAWVSAQTFPRNGVLVSDMNRSDEEALRFGLVGDHGHLGLALSDGDQVLKVVDSSPLPYQEWTHVAVVKTSDELRLYRNGALVSSEPMNGFQAQPNQQLSIGGIPKESGAEKRSQRMGFWHGRIDELAFFGSALTSDQIEHLFRITPSL